MISPLGQKLAQAKWGEFSYNKIFNQIVQGKRLKKDDQIPGKMPFIMAGTTNTGVANYVANPISIFPGNSITIDIFGNVFYRDFEFGAGDDTGVYWNDKTNYSRETMMFFASAMAKSLKYKFSYGKKLRSSQSHDFKMKLPVKNGEIDFEFINSFVAELEAERVAELEAYLSATGLKNYVLNETEQKALKDFDSIVWEKFRLGDLFEVKSYTKKFDANKVNILEQGNYPYVVRMSSNNGQKGYIDGDIQYLNEGNTISFGQDTATMFYQEKPYFTGDKIKILKSKHHEFGKNNAQFFLTAMTKAFSSFSWGSHSYSVDTIESQIVVLPTKNSRPDYTYLEIFINAIQKLVIKNVVQYADRKIAATKKAIQKS